MPVLEPYPYKPVLYLRNGHVQTMFPRFLVNVPRVEYVRERIDTPDGDFIDLDASLNGERNAVLVLHGLEGSSQRHYIKGMVHTFHRRGWDAFAMNYRSCSGEPNRTLRFYHQGATDDLHCVVEHILKKYRHEELALVGFSLGGNLILKYLGDGVFPVSDKITKAAAVSVPCDLKACSEKLGAFSNIPYMQYFLKSLHKKIKEKKRRFPGMIDDQGFEKIRSFREFDERYTAPLHGFSDALDYYEKCSSGPYLPGIQRPTLLINALDDPFFPEECYPYEAAANSDYFHLETPRWGGHVGFVIFHNNGEYWHETRVAQFICGNSEPPTRH